MTTVLLAGATGTLGSQIADNVLQQPGVELRLLVRDAARHNADKQSLLTQMRDRGATLVTCDLDDPAGLVTATSGAEIIISAVRGREATIINGQLGLARAAERNGARRFVASDYALDFYQAPPRAPMFAQRREASRLLGELGLDVFHVLCGGFMDGILDPSTANVIDTRARTVSCFGTGRERFDLTTVADVAAFTTRLALDPAAPAGIHRFAGTQTSADDLAALVSEVTGVRFTVASGGSLDELRAIIDQHDEPWDAEMLWYVLAMFSTPAFDEVENDRYPEIQVTTLRKHLVEQYIAVM